MRVEPHGVGAIMHIIKRGARGMPIVRDENDSIDFRRLLLYLNDVHMPEHLRYDIASVPDLVRPSCWPDRDPLTTILAWTLVPNHFHIIAQEHVENGIAKLMQRLCGSMSMCSNVKYEEIGSIFQGGYKGIVVDSDPYLRYLTSYVLVKNVFELHPKGFAYATNHFDEVWEWALHYPYSSLCSVALDESSPIVQHQLLRDLFSSDADFKQESKQMLITHLEKYDKDMHFLTLELDT